MKLSIRHTGNSSLSGRAQEFDAPVIRIGRKPGNDIVYDPGRDHLVSGDHAELRVSGRHVTVTDLGSRNGTFVNGQRISAPTPVRPRDRITLGHDGPEMALEFVTEPIAVATVAPTMVAGGGGSPPTLVGTSQRSLGSADLDVYASPPPASRGLLDEAAAEHDDAAAALRPSDRAAASPAVGLGARPVDLPPGAKPAHAHPAAVGRPPSRASQGHYRPIGLNTLMGVLDRSKKDERRRMLKVVAPVCLILITASIIASVYFGRSPPPVDWSKVYARIEPSVYQVQFYDKQDGRLVFQGSGTAWSVRPGLLATNAHVAEMVEKAGTDGLVVARRVDSSHDLRIVKARLHPGWREYEKTWYDYQPFVPEQSDFLPHSLSACDVALLEVHKDDLNRQGPPLPLNLRSKLSTGQRVAFLGYPTEGITMNYDRPAPTTNDGAVNKLLGFVLEEMKESDAAYFVGHSLTTLGGSSGSPIVNENGEVVAVNFAGEYQGRASDGTRLSVVGYKYAAPLRFLQEMLDGTAESRQVERRAEWAKTLQARFEIGVKEPMSIMTVMAAPAKSYYYDLVRRTVPNLAFEAVKLNKRTSGVVDLNGTKKLDVPIPGPGVYVLAICADTPGGDLVADVVLPNQRAPLNEMTVSKDETRRTYYGYELLRLENIDGAGTLPVSFASNGKAMKVNWALLQAEH